MKKTLLPLLTLALLPALCFSQDTQATPLYPAPGNTADAQPQQNTTPDQNSEMPVFRVSVSARSTRAVNYRHRGGSTTVDTGTGSCAAAPYVVMQ